MKTFLKWLGGIILFVLLLVVSLIGPIDRSPIEEKDFYKDMMAELDTVKLVAHPASQILKTAWGQVNITPGYPMSMAGYTQRPRFESVHDSLFARVVSVDNGTINAYFISTDLLLFPPALRDRINEILKAKEWRNYFLYLSSTHTHNGLGGWENSLLGKVIVGEFHEEWIESTARSIVSEMERLNGLKQESKLSYFENDLSDWVENRIAFEQGQIDGIVRGFSITRKDSTKGIVFAFSAHATTIGKENHLLSGDYPAATIRMLKEKGWDFGMYMAGMVGSHRFKYVPEKDFDAIEVQSKILAERMEQASFKPFRDSVEITTAHVPIKFGPSQLRIEQNWKVRDWAFRLFSTRLKGEITYLKMGNLIFMGMPCDFSGELFTRDQLGLLADQSHQKLIITSFNGDYVGYITYDQHYETLRKEEVMAMNWVGPYYGGYFSTMVKKLLAK